MFCCMKRSAVICRPLCYHRRYFVRTHGNGRILIPRKMLDGIGMEKDEIVMVGQDSKIEIWGKIKYEESAMDTDEFVLLTSQIGL